MATSFLPPASSIISSSAAGFPGLSHQTASGTPSRLTSNRKLKAPGPGLRGVQTASTPNLNAIYTAQATGATRQFTPSLSRKSSFATLNNSALATIPDASESYAYETVLRGSMSPGKMPPATPGTLPSAAAGDVAIGDFVDVPGGMYGTVRFVGSVQGRKGTFAGVELDGDFAPRGKNSGDVDGVSYFNTTVPGAGIFLPVTKAVRRDSLTPMGSFPHTPTAMTVGGLKVASQNSTNYTPPTPSLSKFSQSVGPARAASPTGRKPRPSLPRPGSPVRQLQMSATPRPSMATPAPKPPARYGSPTSNKFAQSVRGTAGDPSKKTGRPEPKGSIGPRSASALGGAISGFTDDETTPVGRPKTNGSVSSVSSLNLRMRPPSRTNNANDEEVDRLKAQLDERDRQLKDQAATLAEMESSLAEVQTLMDSPDGLRLGSRGGAGSVTDDKDTVQLRALLREKNDKIAMLTAEFDAHRADFRSTIDTLEMASTETERVYEKKIEELMQEMHDLQERTADVDTVAQQLKQLEELVQELEEGLEDARRGEAEARGEVEFLRGEVERTRSELRREREKAQAAVNGPNGATNGDRTSMSMSKELEQKEDEIRGLKAIIHSLSRDSMPGNNDTPDRPSSQRGGSFKSNKGRQSFDSHVAREKLERELSELRAVVDSKNRREEELEREVEQLRRGSATASNMNSAYRGSAMTTGSTQRSSLRDSRGTVVLARDREPPTTNPEAPPNLRGRGHTLDTMPESDAYSTATENSTLWCELCETAGHDILNCTNMFGQQAPAAAKAGAGSAAAPTSSPAGAGRSAKDGLKNLTLPGAQDAVKPAPLSPVKSRTMSSVPASSVKILPNPMDSGPVAGKDSGVIDSSKWCALCERDGHDSVDCPYENAF